MDKILTIIAGTFRDAKDAPTSFEPEEWIEGFQDGRVMIAERIALRLADAGLMSFDKDRFLRDCDCAESDDLGRPCLCLNCMWNGGEEELNPIKDFGQRVEPGDTTVPAGECPECGCLAYLKDDDDEAMLPAGEGSQHYAPMTIPDEPVHVPGLNEALAPKGDA